VSVGFGGVGGGAVVKAEAASAVVASAEVSLDEAAMAYRRRRRSLFNLRLVVRRGP
jgi:hypothetical protein